MEKVINKVDDERLIIETTTVNEEVVKKSSLELRREDMIIRHAEELKEVNDLLAVFK